MIVEPADNSDIQVCDFFPVSASGRWRTLPWALHMSAFDPRRTSRDRPDLLTHRRDRPRGDVRRRKFVSLLGGAIAWPIVARAQQGERRIGMLVNGSEADAEAAARVATFRKTLQDFGWVPGTNLSNFVRIGSGEKFDPHITIGVATIPYQKKMLAEPFDAFTFSPAGASV